MSTTKQTVMLKRFAQEELEKEYGFAPDFADIALIEGHFEVVNLTTGKKIESPQYVLCSVNGHEYSCDGLTVEKRN